MPHGVCPWWLGYVLASPLRLLFEDPHALLSPHVRPGMMVLEPGCGMGFFTLELARLVGPAGRVVAVDLQPRMLAGLRRRLRRAGLEPRVDARQATPERLGLEGLEERADLALALHVVHEVPDQRAFFAELAGALKPGGALLVVEPRGHVSAEELARTVQAAEESGLLPQDAPAFGRDRVALLSKPGRT
jgi:ubiquinone/menaquinone biosynthesis C-methylase UbiE